MDSQKLENIPAGSRKSAASSLSPQQSRCRSFSTSLFLLLSCLVFALGYLPAVEADSSGGGGRFSTFVEISNSTSQSLPGVNQTTVNITALGAAAPICATLCYPWDIAYFANHRNPCQQHYGDSKWLSCLCTDRPFMRYIFDCVFRKCGPAIPTTIDFGYQICQSQNISLPSPPDLVRILNITLPSNLAFELPTTVPNLIHPFATVFPAPLDGASDSGDNPALTRNLSLSASGAGRTGSLSRLDGFGWLVVAGMIWGVWVVGLLGV